MRAILWSFRRFLACFLTVAILGGFKVMAAVPAWALVTAPAPDQAYEAVDAFLQEQIDAIGLPGAAIVVVKDGVQVP